MSASAKASVAAASITGGTLNIDAAHACRHREGGWAADERDDSATACGFGSYGIAHLAGGEVADEAHRVDALDSRAGGDEHPATSKAACGAKEASTAAIIFSGSSMRPRPRGWLASSPVARFDDMDTVGTSCASERAVVGCAIMSKSIAGATNTGHRAER